MSRRNATAVVMVMLAVLAALIGAVGGAAAADVELTNQTVGVDAETRSVYADLNATADVNTTANFTVIYEGIDADGNVTSELDRRNVTVDSGNTSLVEYTSVNSSAYESVRVTVMLDNTTASTENVSASVGTIQMVAGSGGGSSGSSFSVGELGTGALALIALAGAVLLLGGDE